LKRVLSPGYGACGAGQNSALILQNPLSGFLFELESVAFERNRVGIFADNAGAAGVRLDPDLLREIDTLLAGVITRDPARTESPRKRP